jgi:hypothetical protein
MGATASAEPPAGATPDDAQTGYACAAPSAERSHTGHLGTV